MNCGDPAGDDKVSVGVFDVLNYYKVKKAEESESTPDWLANSQQSV